MTSAIVVGSGPNGLAAAVELATAGVAVTVVEGAATVGGGMRTAELTLPGLRHDVCSAVHVLGAGSPYLRTLPLEEHGLRWRHASFGVAHPLDDGTAAVQHRTLDETADALGADADAWRRLMAGMDANVDALLDEIMQPVAHVPAHPLTLASFGLRALLPATTLAGRLRTDAARALFAGAAAHAIHPLSRPMTAAAGLVLLAVGQRYGWPVAEGGSQAIADALVSLLRAHGGRVETGTWVRSLADLPPADLVLLDVAPRDAVSIVGDAMPSRVARQLRRYRHGPGAFKLDLAVDGGVPWTAPEARSAATVHLGGTLEEIAAAEQAVGSGHMPARPFVLVAQQHVADPTRSVGDVHPVWVYCHVPPGWTGDATEHVLAQLERFAPGTRDRIVGTHTMSTADLEAYNPSYVGGDIATGANDALQLVMRPRPTLRPYSLGVRGVYLCSAATPPGAGVHGMPGLNAARAALKTL